MSLTHLLAISFEMPLREIFKLMYQLEKGKHSRVKPKASIDELESYFSKVFQDYDEDRVYGSDIKKIIQWYNLLLDSNELKFDLPKEEKLSDREEV